MILIKNIKTMKNLLLGILLLFGMLSFGQNDTIVNFNTSQVSYSGLNLKQDNFIVITKEGVDITMTNKKQIKELQKYSSNDMSKPVRLVDFKMFDVKIITQNDSQIIFKGNDVRVTYTRVKTESLKSTSLMIEMRDSFTNDIKTFFYYHTVLN